MSENGHPKLDLPSRWGIIKMGATTLVTEEVDGEHIVRFSRTSDYSGGDAMVGVYRIEGGKAHEEFRELGGSEKSWHVLQDRINRVK